MSVRVLYDNRSDEAALYCSSSGHAFGPVFQGPCADERADQFLEWLRENSWRIRSTPSVTVLGGDGKDARDYSMDSLEFMVRTWEREEKVTA